MSKKILTVVTLVVAILTLVFPAAAQRKGRRMTHVDLLVLNGTLVTMDKDHRVIDDAGVAVTGGRIVGVRTSQEIARRYSAAQKGDVGRENIILAGYKGRTH